MQALALLLAHFVLGFFFVSYRFRWFYDPSPPQGGNICNIHRHLNLRRKLCACGWGISPAMGIFVALSETLAGLGAMFGLFTSLSAIGLLIILLVATACTAKEKTLRQNPVDRIDVVNCYLWNPEPVYIVLAVIVASFGGGPFSLDTIFWHHWVF